jgi:K+-sensing histidine kinase KdpD
MVCFLSFKISKEESRLKKEMICKNSFYRKIDSLFSQHSGSFKKYAKILQTYPPRRDFMTDKNHNLRPISHEISTKSFQPQLIEYFKNEILTILIFLGMVLAYLRLQIQYRKLLKERKCLEDLNHSKAEMLSLIGHDLRSSIHQILSCHRRMDESLKTEDYNLAKRFLLHSSSTTTRTYFLLDNLLHWIRIRRDRLWIHKKEHQLFSIIYQTLAYFSVMMEEQQIEMDIEVDENIVFLTDDVVLKTVIRNLIDNAIKYSSERGKISIRCIQNQYRVVILIKDQGTGIDKKKLQQLSISKNCIKNDKRKALHENSSFGIYLCRSFMNKLGGKLTILSKKNLGTTVIISLPK